MKQLLGSFLVTGQFALIGVLLWLAVPAFINNQVPPGAWALAVLGAGVGLWALSANRPGNFNIRPNPRQGAQLVQQGPYRWVRHPMYTAVLLFACASAWASASGWAWLAFVALVAVLIIKARTEEQALLLVHPGYAAYRQQTRWFLPWVG